MGIEIVQSYHKMWKESCEWWSDVRVVVDVETSVLLSQFFYQGVHVDVTTEIDRLIDTDEVDHVARERADLNHNGILEGIKLFLWPSSLLLKL